MKGYPFIMAPATGSHQLTGRSVSLRFLREGFRVDLPERRLTGEREVAPLVAVPALPGRQIFLVAARNFTQCTPSVCVRVCVSFMARRARQIISRAPPYRLCYGGYQLQLWFPKTPSALLG